MSDKLSESRVVRAVAEKSAKRITRKVIAALQKTTSRLSGDDSGLKTAWDEICVQVQHEESFSWDAYDDTVKALVATQVAALPKQEREAMWLQTTAGINWNDESEDRVAQPVVDDDIVHWLTDEYIYA